MSRKCIYCKVDVPEESVIDFCARCGVGVWGEKMFKTILKSMEDAREKGDLVSTNTEMPTFESPRKLLKG